MLRTLRAVDRHRTGAALYTLVVFNALLVGLIGLSSILISRIERRMSTSAIDAVQARRHARSGIALAKIRLEQNPNWRTEFTHAVATTTFSVGDGEMEFTLTDQVDSDLEDDPADAIEISATGRFGEAVWVEAVQATPVWGPPEFFKSCLHTGNTLNVQFGARLNFGGGTLSTNGHCNFLGLLAGDLEAATHAGAGIISGLLETDIAPKALPEAKIFADYQALATAIPYSGDMTAVVLASGVNTYGGSTSSEGVYFINPGANVLNLEGVRLNGTLIVDGDVSINQAALLSATSLDYPTLIVRGNLTLATNATGLTLNEADYGVNLNPTGAEYLGQADSDTVDSYPNRIEGFVHVMGQLLSVNSATVHGCILCDDHAEISGSLSIQNNLQHFSHPPLGYEQLPGPKIEFVKNSWRRIPVAVSPTP